MRFLRLVALMLGVIAAFSSIVRAQEDCPAIVRTALDTANQQCSATGRNEACYGNILLDAQPQPGVTDLQFSQPGDTTPVEAIKTLHLSPLDQATNQWGVAVMRIQADLPDTLPGQNVTFLLFGDVQITNAVGGESAPTITATAATNANIRAHPSTSAAVLSSLAPNTSITVDGILADQSWLHVRQSDQDVSGWVLASLLNIEGNLDTLSIIDPAASTVSFAPMQAFYFQTGVGDRPCESAPDSGILVQTPEGAGRVHLRANEVDITLGSTAYLQSGGGTMTVSVVDGTATLETDGVTQFVPAGTYSEIPLGTDGMASGSPAYPQPYDYEALTTLPVQIALPKTVTIAPALVEADISAAVSEAEAEASAPGDVGTFPEGSGNGLWVNHVTVLENTCDPERIPVGQTSSANPTFTFSPDRSSFLFDWKTGEAYTFTLVSGTTYVVHRNPSETWTITFTSPTTYTSDLYADYRTCVYHQTETGNFIG
jgi:hypothetical protein